MAYSPGTAFSHEVADVGALLASIAVVEHPLQRGEHVVVAQLPRLARADSPPSGRTFVPQNPTASRWCAALLGERAARGRPLKAPGGLSLEKTSTASLRVSSPPSSPSRGPQVRLKGALKRDEARRPTRASARPGGAVNTENGNGYLGLGSQLLLIVSTATKSQNGSTLDRLKSYALLNTSRN